MAVTDTYEFELPTVSGDTNTWGNKLNDNWAKVDDLLDGTLQLIGTNVVNAVLAGTFDGIIGGTTPATGTFTTLVATSVAFTGGAIDDTVIGETIPAASTFTSVDVQGTVTATSATIGFADINGGTFDSVIIGNTAAGPGTFTVLTGGTLAIDVDTFVVDNANDRVGINTDSPDHTLDIVGTDGVLLPLGTTAQRPVATAGVLRFNTQTNKLEYVNNAEQYVEVAETVGSSLAPTILETVEVTSSTVSIELTTFNNAIYQSYEIYLSNMVPSATNSYDLEMQISHDGGATYEAGGRYRTVYREIAGGNSGEASSGSVGQFLLVRDVDGNITDRGASGKIHLFNFGDSTKESHITYLFSAETDRDETCIVGAGKYLIQDAIDAVKLEFDAVNIGYGKVTLVGIPKVS